MRIPAIKVSSVAAANPRAGRIVNYVTNAVKNEKNLIFDAIKNKDYKSIFKVKNPIHGTVKYGALGFLIPIPGMQIVGMAFGAVAGLVVKAKKLFASVFKKIL